MANCFCCLSQNAMVCLAHCRQQLQQKSWKLQDFFFKTETKTKTSGSKTKTFVFLSSRPRPLSQSGGLQHWGWPYYRTLIGNNTQSIERYHFQWPWLTLDWDFKVAIFFNIEYLRNDTRSSHSYYRTSTGSHKLSTEWWHFQLFNFQTLNPVFKVTAFLKSNILIVPKMRRFWDIWFQERRDLENRVSGLSRSLKMSSFDRAHTTSYWRSIVNMALSLVVSMSKKIPTLKTRSGINQGHWMCYHSIHWIWFPISIL